MSDIKLVLQPLGAGIVRAFKLKYRKLLIRYIISRVDDNNRASDIINEINILKVIGLNSLGEKLHLTP